MAGDIPEGMRFSVAYLRPEKPIPDSKKFRSRLSGVFADQKFTDQYALVTHLKMTCGIDIQPGVAGMLWDAFFKSAPIVEVLDAIGEIYAYFLRKTGWAPRAEAWKAYVEHIIHEEALGYRLDTKGAVRRMVDEEFQRNRYATIAGLGAPRYRTALEFFDRANAALEQNPIDALGLVRNVFDANEEVFKLKQNLPGGRLVEGNARTAFSAGPGAAQAAIIATKAHASSFANWVTACQQYRHAPGEEPQAESVIAPPLDLALALYSNGTTFLRDLIAREQQEQSQTA